MARNFIAVPSVPAWAADGRIDRTIIDTTAVAMIAFRVLDIEDPLFSHVLNLSINVPESNANRQEDAAFRPVVLEEESNVLIRSPNCCPLRITESRGFPNHSSRVDHGHGARSAE